MKKVYAALAATVALVVALLGPASPAAAATNPYTPEGVCGSGYSIIDHHVLSWGGTVYLLYNSGNGYNCVATIKSSYVGTATYTWALFSLSESPFNAYQDSDDYKYYAVAKGYARGYCIQWGGGTYASSSQEGSWQSAAKTHCG